MVFGSAFVSPSRSSRPCYGFSSCSRYLSNADDDLIPTPSFVVKNDATEDEKDTPKETTCFDHDRVRIRTRVAYDGSGFCGFQLQRRGRSTEQGPYNKKTSTQSCPQRLHDRHDQQSDRTVQGTLEEVLSRRFQRVIAILGAGRTDAGVHAKGQAVHFDLTQDEAHHLDLGELETSLNRMLPTDVRVWNVQKAPPPVEKLVRDDGEDNDGGEEHSRRLTLHAWNALLDSTGKLYTYRFCLGDAMDPLLRHDRWQLEWGRDVDPDRLAHVLKQYEGQHDFVCFSGALERNERKTGVTKSTIRAVQFARLVRDDHGGADMGLYRIDIRLDGALYKMVRNMVGTAVDVARGWLDEDTFLDLLHRPADLKWSRKNNPCKPAPPNGLTLERVYYSENEGF